jgi:hypothetical protein
MAQAPPPRPPPAPPRNLLPGVHDSPDFLDTLPALEPRYSAPRRYSFIYQHEGGRAGNNDPVYWYEHYVFNSEIVRWPGVHAMLVTDTWYDMSNEPAPKDLGDVLHELGHNANIQLNFFGDNVRKARDIMETLLDMELGEQMYVVDVMWESDDDSSALGLALIPYNFACMQIGEEGENCFFGDEHGQRLRAWLQSAMRAGALFRPTLRMAATSPARRLLLWDGDHHIAHRVMGFLRSHHDEEREEQDEGDDQFHYNDDGDYEYDDDDEAG